MCEDLIGNRYLPTHTHTHTVTHTHNTSSSAINNNFNLVHALAIDNFSEYGGPKDVFLNNVNKFKTNKDLKSFLYEVSERSEVSEPCGRRDETRVRATTDKTDMIWSAE